MKEYATESDLCIGFAEYAKTIGWKVYPETSGADLLLVATAEVRTRGCRPGDQVAIQAKLRANVEVLYQALPKMRSTKGPNFTAVLVPRCTHDFRAVAQNLSIITLTAYTYRRSSHFTRDPGFGFLQINATHRHEYGEPLWVPDAEVWTTPGVKNPKSITPWKMKAIRLCVKAKSQGYLLASDFREVGMSMTTWRREKWLKDSGLRIGKQTRYVLDDVQKPPHILYPDLFVSLTDL